MSINNPIVVINALTANIIKLENDNFDLKARLKDSREQLAGQHEVKDWVKKYDELADSHNKLTKQLTDCRNALNNRPKYECPVHEHPSFIESQKQTERANETIAELEEQLSAERCAAGYLRSYIIESLQSANSAALLAQYVVDKAKAANNVKPMRFKGGFLALEPIARGVGDGIMRKYLQDAMEELKSIQPTNIKVK